MTEDRQMTMLEMADLVNPGLLNHIGKAFESYVEQEAVTVSSGEMTVAAGLAMEMGHSCDTEEEIKINAEAYYRFILHYALRVLKSRSTSMH